MEIAVVVHEAPTREQAQRAAELLAGDGGPRVYGVVEWVAEATDRPYGVIVAAPSPPAVS